LREQQQLLENCVMLSLKRIQKYAYFDKKQAEVRKIEKKSCLPILVGDKNGAFEKRDESMVLVFNAYLVKTGALAPVNFCALCSEGIAELDFREV
jgi:hypothetical protein